MTPDEEIAALRAENAALREQVTVLMACVQELEAHVLAFSRQIAFLRQRHAACLAQAREHAEAAGRLQPAQAPPDRW